jgi:hypothetical protein
MSAAPNSIRGSEKVKDQPKGINLRPHLGRTMSGTPSGAANAAGIAAENSNVKTMLQELLLLAPNLTP